LFNDYKFTKRESMGPITKDIKTVYAKYFCNDDLKQAKRNLEKSNSTSMNKEDIFVLSFLGGGVFIFFVFMLFFVTKIDPEIF
jgi:hypothetical protein